MTDVLQPPAHSTIEPSEVARWIHRGFLTYHGNFSSITRRAKIHFERSEWALQTADAKARLTLHRDTVNTTVDRVSEALPDQEARTHIWREVRSTYAGLISNRADIELAETFFNSVTRRIFGAIGVDNDLELRWLGATMVPQGESTAPIFQTFTRTPSTRDMIDDILAAYEYATAYARLESDAKNIAECLDEFLLSSFDTLDIDGVDLMRPVFYRNKGAYVIGRVRYLNRVAPFVLPLLSSEEGIVVDTVLMHERHVSRMFGVTRSYFHVEWDSPAQVVGFLKSILPSKAIAELYTSIGFNQHGKTALYRSLYRHMSNSTHKFEQAPGTKGMVMVVFALPSFDVVFKVIRDKFAPPKKITRQGVMDKYHMVFEHDRVGRMVDAQEFENLSFDRDRFTKDLIEELAADASDSVTITEDEVILHHLYTERRLYPLNLYLDDMGIKAAELAALDYGKAIKDLAAANIFPGDLFTKNFGVTRHGHVVFYDYDEICLLEACNFRTIPKTDSFEDEMRSGPWFSVGPDDVFPEQFPTFMRFPGDIRATFIAEHHDLFEADFWQKLKDEHREGLLPDFYPYPTYLRFDQ